MEFNEDLTAFHGPTIEAQTAYASQAISYILSLYPPRTSIIIMGHSMGGIVATSLLPSENISAIITMSAPHTLPPARFDARIDKIYANNQKILSTDPTPILSLCGGATDMMIPSESCILPLNNGVNLIGPFRRTVFSSALEGAWTGVGHREMVWCHQVRWRVARAALELGASSTAAGRGVILDRWLRDGHALPPLEQQDSFLLTDPSTYEVLPADLRLVLRNPVGSRTYLLPVPSSSSAKMVLFVSGGSISSVSPQNPLSLRATVFLCSASQDEDTPRCISLKPSILKLIPNPVIGQTFPVPDEGSDESEGVVLLEADVPETNSPNIRWVGVKIEDASGKGWVVGGFSPTKQVINNIGTTSKYFSAVNGHDS